MGRRIVVVGSLLIALVGIPRASEAGLLELIWEMSGPRMLGVGYGCLYSPRTHTWEQCRLGSNPVAQEMNTATKKGPFFALGGFLAGSTGRDSKTQGYDPGEIWMLAFEPGVAVRSYEDTAKKIQLHHGVGISYELLFGDDIQRFDKFAITVTPIDVTYNRIAFGVKYRLYPNGFTDDEFKPGPRVDTNRPFESVLGFTFSLIVKKCCT